jgi:putative Mg2+ transporter-C (MgtC) family protein
MVDDLTHFVQPLSLVDVTPVLLAVVLGGAVGFELEIHGRPAGLRTHMLVCLASALLIYASRRVPIQLADSNSALKVVMDPNRLAAGIVTGIGFLGASTVIRAGDIVRGITTGATVWYVAGLGVVIGQGEYVLAVASTFVVILVLAGVDRLSRRIAPVIYRRMIVTGMNTELPSLSRRVSAILSSHGIRVQDVSGRRGASTEPFELVFHVRCRNTFQAPEMMDQVASEQGILRVEWSQISH